MTKVPSWPWAGNRKAAIQILHLIWWEKNNTIFFFIKHNRALDKNKQYLCQRRRFWQSRWNFLYQCWMASMWVWKDRRSGSRWWFSRTVESRRTPLLRVSTPPFVKKKGTNMMTFQPTLGAGIKSALLIDRNTRDWLDTSIANHVSTSLIGCPISSRSQVVLIRKIKLSMTFG